MTVLYLEMRKKMEKRKTTGKMELNKKKRQKGTGGKQMEGNRWR